MNSKKKGRAGEERAIKTLEEAGYVCTLSHLSRGPWDVVAVNVTGIRFIQVKVDDSKEWRATQPRQVEIAFEELDFDRPNNATIEYWVSRKNAQGRYEWVMQEARA